MLKIDAIETASAVTLELHGRLVGPWVPLLEALWRSTEVDPAGRTIAVDLTDVMGIDGAGRDLLQGHLTILVRLSGATRGSTSSTSLDLASGK